MTQAARTPLRVPPVLSILFLSLWLAALTWVGCYSEYRIFPFAIVGQVYLVIGVLLAFRYWPPVTLWLKAMPIPHRVVFGLLVGGMILGHLTLRPAAFYPFTAWGIFSDSRTDDPVTCPEFIATTKSGKEARLLVEQQFPSIIQVWPLEGGRYPTGMIDRLADILAKAYNSRHPGDPVQQVELVQMSVKLKPNPGASSIQPSCLLLKRYDISSGH